MQNFSPFGDSLRHPTKDHSRRDQSPTADLPKELTGKSLDVPQLVDRIIQINPTAGGSHLSGFGRAELSEYLARLVAAQAPRGRDARWIRRGDSPAASVRRARDAR